MFGNGRCKALKATRLRYTVQTYTHLFLHSHRALVYFVRKLWRNREIYYPSLRFKLFLFLLCSLHPSFTIFFLLCIAHCKDFIFQKSIRFFFIIIIFFLPFLHSTAQHSIVTGPNRMRIMKKNNNMWNLLKIVKTKNRSKGIDLSVCVRWHSVRLFYIYFSLFFVPCQNDLVFFPIFFFYSAEQKRWQMCT